MNASMQCAVGVVLLLLAAYLTDPISAQHSATVANHTNVCFGRTIGQERHLTNCNQYFTCANGHPTLRTCTAGHLYSHITQRCEVLNATLQQQCFRCPDTTSHVNLPADFQCQQFVRCFRGTAEQRTCSAGLLFDPVTRTCNLAERVKCACPAVDRPERPWFIRDRSNCAKYEICIRGTTVPLTCPPGLHFNRTLTQCDSPREPECVLLDQNNNSTTAAPGPTPDTVLTTPQPTRLPTWPATTQQPPTPPTSTMAPFRCKTNDVNTFEPHPYDCSLFYVCAFGIGTVSPCPNSSLFDSRTLSCVEPHLAECFAPKNTSNRTNA